MKSAFVYDTPAIDLVNVAANSVAAQIGRKNLCGGVRCSSASELHMSSPENIHLGLKTLTQA